MVSPSGSQGLDFDDEADTVNALCPSCQGKASRRSSCCSTRAASSRPGEINELRRSLGARSSTWSNRPDRRVDLLVRATPTGLQLRVRRAAR